MKKLGNYLAGSSRDHSPGDDELISGHQKTMGNSTEASFSPSSLHFFHQGKRPYNLHVASLPSDEVLVAVEHLGGALLDLLGDPVAQLVVPGLRAVAHAHLQIRAR